MEHLPSGETTVPAVMQRIGDHLLNQVEYNPLITEPSDKFNLAAAVVEYTDSDRAVVLAQDILDQNDSELQPHFVHGFANSLLRRGGDWFSQVLAVAEHLPDYDSEMSKASILTSIAKRTTDDDLRDYAIHTAINLIDDALEDPEKATNTSLADLTLSLAVCMQNSDLVNVAAKIFQEQPLNNVASFTKIAADGMKQRVPFMHIPLLEAVISAQKSVAGNLASIVHNDFEYLLSPAEMRLLLRAVKGAAGERRLVGHEKFQFDDPSVIIAGNGETMEKFIALTNRYVGWTSVREELKYYVRTRIENHHDRTAAQYNASRRDLRSVDYTLSQVFKNCSGDLHDADLVDSALSIGSIRTDVSPASLRLRKIVGGYFGWADLTNRIENNLFDDIPDSSLQYIHTLRDRLPVLSAARLSLNVALYKSGDPDALGVMEQDITGQPDALILKARQPNTPRRPDFMAYDLGLLWELKHSSAEAA